MKTKEELNALKEEVKVVGKKLAELTEEELSQVSGGNDTYPDLYDIFKKLKETEKELREKAKELRK